jgi:SAM-dependent methyltransferase
MPSYCPICQSANTIKLREYKSTSSILKSINLTSCNNCFLVFANPMPEIDIWNQYNSDYFNVAHGGITNDTNTINFFKGMAAVRMNYILNYLILNSIVLNSILEIGPGVGYLAEKWLKFFPNIKYSVVETDSSCHSALKKLGVNVFKDIKQIPESSIFDLVIHSHVLEHVIKPVDFLELNIKYLGRGGVLFIDVPCNDWKFKEIDEPHLLFFDKIPMFHLLNNILKHKNIQISYHGNEISKIIKMQNFSLSKKIAIKLRLNILFKIFNWFLFFDNKYLTLNEYLMIYDFKPHFTNEKESWWLRSVSIK